VFDKSANFNIFDTPKSPYSTFNFQYSNEAFDRLHQLMEFNTLLHFDVNILIIMEVEIIEKMSQMNYLNFFALQL